MQLDPPCQLTAAIAVAYRYHLWSIGGQPEVWHHVPYKREGLDKKTNKVIPAIPPHWAKIPALADIPRLDAKMDLTAAWDEYRSWSAAYSGQGK